MTKCNWTSIGRCSLMGFDLNRHWSEPSPWAHPTLYATKNLLMELDRSDVSLFCAQYFLFQNIYTEDVYFKCTNQRQSQGWPYVCNTYVRLSVHLSIHQILSYSVRLIVLLNFRPKWCKCKWSWWSVHFDI